jgi:hypothetical protein
VNGISAEVGTRMGPSLPLLRRAALVLLMVVVAACAPPLEHGDRAVHYGGIDELVASADAVVVGRVVQTSRGRVLDQQDAVRRCPAAVPAGRRHARSVLRERSCDDLAC